MLICQNAKGVHRKRKVGNPCSSVTWETLCKLIRYIPLVTVTRARRV